MLARTKRRLLSLMLSLVGVCTMGSVAALDAPAEARAEGNTKALSQTATWEAMDINDGVLKTKSDDSVEYASWGGFSGDTYMMTQFTGKNVPTLVFRANAAYGFVDVTGTKYTNGSVSGWGGGLALSNSYVQENSAGYRNGRLYYTAGLHAGASMAMLGASDDMTVGFGTANYQADTTYIMIAGVTGSGTAANTLKANAQVFAVNEDGSLTAGQRVDWTYASAHGVTGATAAIYPNVLSGEASNDLAEITFSYEAPQTSISALLNNLSETYEYKNELLEAYFPGSSSSVGTKVTFEAMEIYGGAANTSKSDDSVDVVSWDGFGGNAYAMVQFTGKNAPNFIFRANAAYGFVDVTGAKYTNGSVSGWGGGIGFMNTYIPDGRARDGVMYHTAGVHASTSIALTNPAYTSGVGLGMAALDSNKTYIQIVGLTDACTLQVKTFVVNADGTLTKGVDTSATLASSGAVGSTLAIYPNIIGLGTKENSPEQITFSYAKPATTLKDLVNQLDKGYPYKAELKKALGVPATVTAKDSAGETVASGEVAIGGEYTLPENGEQGFIGWNYEGKLYAAGDKITVNGDTTVTARVLQASMEGKAAIRVAATAEQYGGIRFPVKVKTSELTALGDNIKLYGQIIPNDMIDGSYDVGEKDAMQIELTNSIVDGEYTVYYITLTNILYSNYNRQFSALAYATVQTDGGVTTVVIGSGTRSVYEVAVAAYNDTAEYEKLSSNGKAVLKEYIDSTIVLTVEENGVYAVATTEDGLAATYERGYQITAQETSAGKVTLTVAVTLAARLYEKNADGLPHIPLTVYVNGEATRIVTPTTQSYTDGVLTLVF